VYANASPAAPAASSPTFFEISFLFFTVSSSLAARIPQTFSKHRTLSYHTHTDTACPCDGKNNFFAHQKNL
jgi:hypothetical protein